MTVKTFTATIYVGLRHHYDEQELPTQPVVDFIQNWVNKIGMCVTVTPTQFIYTASGGGIGHENGLIVGFINYPRFPSDEQSIRMHALDLAGDLLKFCKQMRISVVFPDKTVMLSNDQEIEEYENSKGK